MPKWSFDPSAMVESLINIYNAVTRAPEKFSNTEANMPESERPDRKDERFFDETSKSGAFDLFSERVSLKYGPPYCALCFKVLLPGDGDLHHKELGLMENTIDTGVSNRIQ